MIKSRQRDYLFGLVSVLGILAVSVAPTLALEFVMAAMAAGIVYWVARCPMERIVLRNGVPRPLIFGLLVAGLMVNFSVVRFFRDNSAGSLGLTLSLLLLATALLVGLLRILWQPDSAAD